MKTLVSFAPIIIATVGIVTAGISIFTLRLTRQAFLSNHRPCLRVRRIILNGFSGRYGAENLSHMDAVQLKITVVNVGGTQARIVDSRYRIHFYKDKIPAEIPYEDPPRKLTDKQIMLAVGQAHAFEMPGQAILKDPGDGTRIMQQFASEGWSMLAIGEIKYRDDAGRDRLTGFLRVWENGGRFGRVDNPDYEYED